MVFATKTDRSLWKQPFLLTMESSRLLLWVFSIIETLLEPCYASNSISNSHKSYAFLFLNICEHETIENICLETNDHAQE